MITLREAPYESERNSNMDAWMTFAWKRKEEGYEVIFVRDTVRADDPIEGFHTFPDASRIVEERIKVYASAFCNLSKTTGPASSLLPFSDLPFVLFYPLEAKQYCPHHPDWWTRTAGFTPPEKHPWLADDQIVEWVQDTHANIENGWQRWLRESSRGL